MKKISNALTQGTRLRGPRNTYCIQHALGQGTFGITYLATTEMEVIGQMGTFKTTVKVAVKEFFMKDFNGRERAEVTVSSPSAYFVDYKRKFLREAENLSKLQCPHIVKVLESFEANNTAYYAMEYLEGGSLDDYIKLHGALNEGVTVKLAKQIGYALMYMHEHRMLHLDLKPSNVMLRFTGDAVLIDFGLSKQFDKKGVPETSTSLGGGTPGYAPLEQTNYQRGDALPVTMDVYAFGATMYKMLTGECPPNAYDVYSDGFPSSVFEKHQISDSLMNIVRRAMKPAHKDRYQNMREVIDALCDIKRPSFSIGEMTVLDKEQECAKQKTNGMAVPMNEKESIPEKEKHSNGFLCILCLIGFIAGIVGFFLEWPHGLCIALVLGGGRGVAYYS